MPPISVMLKPASADCNLACDYCFYRDLSKNRAQFSHGRMSKETMKKVVSEAFCYASGSCASFTLQGGEPLLCGLDFLVSFFDTIGAEQPPNTKVSLSLQTNGTLLTAEICAVLKKNNVLVGLSLDGSCAENFHRKTANGAPAFPNILRAANLLQQCGVDFNIVSVVTAKVCQNAKKVYAFFVSQGYRYLQFIPCLAPQNAKDTSFAPTCAQYGKFLKELFTCYQRDFFTADHVSIRQFDNILQLLLAGYSEQCGLNGTCSPQFVVEADGAVYPCDFYCTDPWYLGNICNTNFDALAKTSTATHFLSERAALNAQCNTCEHYPMCRGGGCKRAQTTNYCPAYRDFFNHTAKDFRALAKAISLQ